METDYRPLEGRELIGALAEAGITFDEQGLPHWSPDKWLLPTPALLRLSQDIAWHFRDSGARFVVGTGNGSIVAHWTAHFLRQLSWRPVRPITVWFHADKRPKRFSIDDPKNLLRMRGQRVLLVTDVLIEGDLLPRIAKSVEAKHLALSGELLRGVEASMVGVGAFVKRDENVAEKFALRLGHSTEVFALVNGNFRTFPLVGSHEDREEVYPFEGLTSATAAP